MKGVFVCGDRTGSLINLYIRGEDGKKHKITVNDFRPYFYIGNEYGEYEGIFGNFGTRVYVNDPSDVPKEREKYDNTFEADVKYVRRFLINKDIHGGVEFPSGAREITQNQISPTDVNIKPLIMFVDIEVLSMDGFAAPETAEQPVISFTVKLSGNEKYFTYAYKEGIEEKIVKKSENWIVGYVNSERKILNAFFDIVKRTDPDIVTGWNSVKYDLLYLENRFQKFGLRWIDPGRFESFDLLRGYKRIYKQPRYGLKKIAQTEGIITEENPLTFKEARGFYFDDLDRFLEYNRLDVEYVSKINDKHSLIDYFYELKHLVGGEDINDTFLASVLIDIQTLRIAKEKNIILPTKDLSITRGTPYEGAFVLAAEKGIYKDLMVADFKSYYPSIINSFYLSPENILEDKDIKEGDIVFKEFAVRKQKGILQELLEVLLTKKDNLGRLMKEAEPGSDEYKSLYLRRQAIKNQVNSTYGVLAYHGFRLYNPLLAAKVTELAQEGLRHIIKVAEEKGYKVILADTDSIMVQMPLEKSEEFCSELNVEVKKYFRDKYGIDTQVDLGFERYLNRLLLVGVKKRYAYRVSFENGKKCDYTDTKGFENIRTDQSEFTRNLMDDLFDLVLHDKMEKEILEFVNGKLSEYEKKPIMEIAIAKQINKHFNQYKANTPHVRGSVYANQHLNTDFKYGDKVMMLWLKGIIDKPQTNVICFDENTDLENCEMVIDWGRMKNVSIIKKVKPILDALDISLSGDGTKQGAL